MAVERHGTARYGGVSESWPYGGRSVSVVTAEHTNGQATAGINTGNSMLNVRRSTGRKTVRPRSYGPLPGFPITGTFPVLPVFQPVGPRLGGVGA